MAGSGTPLTPLVHLWTRLGRRVFGGGYGLIPPPGPPPEESVVDLGRVRLALLRWRGPGPALVLAHGLNNNAWGWARVAPALATIRDVISVSLRGHGDSSAPETGYGLDDTTGDLLALLDRLGLDRVDLGGHSWGGKVVTHLALSAPDRVRTLALADPVPPAGLNAVLRAFPSLVDAALRPERGPFADRAALEAGGRALPYALAWDAIERRWWFDSFRERPGGSWHHALPEAGHQEILHGALAQDLSPVLDRLRCPVLWLLPTFCLAFLPGELAAVRRAWPLLDVRRVPGDHQFVLTNPADTVRAMLDFLDSHRQLVIRGG
jgi:pimeloyl-ACP methyl ester carboxylesterase